MPIYCVYDNNTQMCKCDTQRHTRAHKSKSKHALIENKIILESASKWVSKYVYVDRYFKMNKDIYLIFFI